MRPGQVVAVVALSSSAVAQNYLSFNTANFKVQLNSSSQTLASLQPSDSDFDFSPFDVLSQRSANGNYHTGDLTLRYRSGTSGTWTNANTATARKTLTAGQAANSSVKAVASLGPTLSGLTALNITRQWQDLDGDLAVVYTIANTQSTPVELGSLGFPIEFNSIFTNRDAEEIREKCSLIDPYIGLGAGYVQVTPLSGSGPALVVTPLAGSDFEAYRFLQEPTNTALAYQSQVFEGFYEWQVHTKAYAENEWSSVEPWNPATSRILQSKESINVGLRFSLAKGGINDIEDTVERVGLPYARAVPGFVVPSDDVSTLYLNSTSSVSSMTTDPSGAFTISSPSTGVYSLTPSDGVWGRVRLTVMYASGLNQTISYKIVKSASTAISDLGTFSTTEQYYNDTSDPFHRAPSVITYDRSINAPVLQDPRVWIAGLSDEAGAGSFLAATMKQALRPSASEIPLLDSFIQNTLWGTIQSANTTTKYAVRKSIFYHDPTRQPTYPYSPSIDWSSWTSWDYSAAYATDRAYDYVHVSAAYWAFYRVARAYPALTTQPWTWYLAQAYETVMYATDPSNNVGYAAVGLMGETVWGSLLTDLGREGNATAAAALEARMRSRAQAWDAEEVPFGSEMAWDSTGQEGVYHWAAHFNLSATATKAITSILSYTPAIAHWGWNANARRYWDNLYGGKLQRIERQIHHYGSALNSLALIGYYRALTAGRMDPGEATVGTGYLLRTAYAGVSAPLSSIDEEGFAAASFHSWPETLEWDAYSGDYGPGFVGLALGSGTYIHENEDGGVDVYGGNVQGGGNEMVVTPRDAVRRRVWFGAWGCGVEIDAGEIETMSVDLEGGMATVSVGQGSEGVAPASAAVVWTDGNCGVEAEGGVESRGGLKVDLSGGTVAVSVSRS